MNSIRRSTIAACVLAFTLVTITSALAQQDGVPPAWPQFRGPAGNGVLDTIAHPLEWSDSQNVAWSVAVPGGGWSSPVVIGDRVILTTSVGPMKPVGFMEGVRDMKSTKPESELTFQVMCLSLKDGASTWSTPLVTKMPEFGIHRSNSYATASPVTDGKLVFCYFASAGVIAAVDLEGVRWPRLHGRANTL